MDDKYVLEMAIFLWTNEDFKNERNFSWIVVSSRKKLNNRGWSLIAQRNEKPSFLKNGRKNNKKERFDIVQKILKKLTFFYLTKKNSKRIKQDDRLFWSNDFLEQILKKTVSFLNCRFFKINNNFENERHQYSFLNEWKKNEMGRFGTMNERNEKKPNASISSCHYLEDEKSFAGRAKHVATAFPPFLKLIILYPILSNIILLSNQGKWKKIQEIIVSNYWKDRHQRICAFWEFRKKKHLNNKIFWNGWRLLKYRYE